MGFNRVVSLCFCTIMALAGIAFGVPADRRVWTFTQPDGTRFQATLHGDEFYLYHQTLEGEIIVQDRDSGEWFYAEPKADGSLRKTAIRVGQSRLTIASQGERPQWQKAVRKIMAQKASDARGNLRVKAGSAKGNVKGLLLLANFKDTSTTYTRPTFNDLMNTTGFRSYGALGSVRDYYLEASYGQLKLQNDVHGWFSLPRTHAYYGKDDANGDDEHGKQMIEDAIREADATVNFADYDSDGDGWVDLFGVVHQGQEQQENGASSDCIVSHRGWLEDPVSVDGVRIQDYYTVPELHYADLATIGGFCHEIGHYFGLPDLYDYDFSSIGLGDWSLMDYGCYLGPNNNGAKPCHFDPWSKYMLGWITPQVANSPQSGVSLPGFDTHPIALLIPVDPYNDGEYFLLVNRYARATQSAATGFDEYVPGSGVLVLHIDDYMPDNDNEARKKVDVEESHGQQDLDDGTDYGDSRDLYPNGGSSFTDTSTPGSRDNDGASTGIAVRNFTGAGTDAMTCDVTPRATLKGYAILYDPMGNDRNYGLGYADGGDDYACVRFRTDNGGVLERVKTAFICEGTTDYTVSVYSGWAGNGPTGLVTTQSGSHTGRSYEEILLSQPQTLAVGAEFAIEIRYNTRGGEEYPLPVADDRDCSGRTYIRSSSTKGYFQLTSANDYPFDALIRADLRPLSVPDSGPGDSPADWAAIAGAPYASLEGLAPGSSAAQNSQRQAVEQLGLPLEIKTRQTGIVFRLVPAGIFAMGSPKTESGRYNDESPQHLVIMTKPFWCGKFEVTQGQWQQVMGSNPMGSTSGGQNAPVGQVFWDECQSFVRKLCQIEGVPEGTYRLLTETEWEYACRAGTVTAFCCGDSEYALEQYAWYLVNSSGQLHPVGQKKGNAFGLHDMHGNVWEWCQDWWYVDYPSGTITDPPGPGSGGSRIFRGGASNDSAKICRSARRNKSSPSFKYGNVGLRIAREIPSNVNVPSDQVTVLTFEDIATNESPWIPDGYGGLSWSGSFCVHGASSDFISGYVNGTISPGSVAYNGGANLVECSGSPFTFVGAYLTGAWRDDLQIEINGYRSDSRIYNRTVSVSSQFPTWFRFDYEAVDRVTFASSGGRRNWVFSSDGTQFVMDDMVIK